MWKVLFQFCESCKRTQVLCLWHIQEFKLHLCCYTTGLFCGFFGSMVEHAIQPMYHHNTVASLIPTSIKASELYYLFFMYCMADTIVDSDWLVVMFTATWTTWS